MEFPTIYSNSYSIGFWIYISNEKEIGDHLININLSKIMTVSIGYDTHISTVCNLFTNSYQNISRKNSKNSPKINDVKTMSEMKNLVNNSNYVNKQTTFNSDMSSKWLHVRCAYSSDAQYFYNMIQYNNNSENILLLDDTKLTNNKYYDKREIDLPSRYFFDRDTSSLTIENANTLTTENIQIYLRNLNIFTEFVSKSSKPQYL